MNTFSKSILTAVLSSCLAIMPVSGFVTPLKTFSHIATAQAAEKVPLAVIDFQSKGNVSDDEASIISDRVRTQMFRTGKYKIMERADMLSILKEQGFQQTQANCEGTNCSVEIGKLLAVRQIMTGSVSKLGSIYTLTFRIIDVEKGEILNDEYRDCRCSLEEVLTRLSIEMVDSLSAPNTAKKEMLLPTATEKTLPKNIEKDAALIEIAKQSATVRKDYYAKNSKAPVLATVLNMFLPLPFGYGYADDWSAFWTMSLIEMGLLGTALVVSASAAPGDEDTNALAGLGYLAYLGVAVYTWFDGWGAADRFNKNLSTQLKLAKDQPSTPLATGSRSQVSTVTLLQHQFKF